jgi:surfactin family lipopeptide synthetase C
MELEHPLPGAYPLTALQQGMLFHSQPAPQEGVYVQQFICDLREPLDSAVFIRAWAQLIERHSILRTSFAWENSETPLQIVHPMVDVPWEQRDWRSRPTAEQELEQEAFLEADRRRGFDLARAPLFRLALFRLAEARYELIWTSHHALLDGRSRLILLEELFAIYEALCNGRAALLAPAVPFRKHVEWLQAENFELSAPFWRDLLAGYDKPTLPNPGPAQERGVARTHAVARESARLSAALSTSLRSLAAEHDFTLNTLLQGAWAILLSRYSGQRRVVFGATRAGRHSGPEQVAKAVGLLINTLPVAVDVDPNAHLLQWLQSLRALWISMRPHEHTPLGKIQAWSGIPAGRSLFDSLVSFEGYEINAHLRKQGKQWRHRTFHLRGQTNYPLVITGAYDGEEVLLEIEFDACLFDHDFIARMIGHLQTILAGIAGDLSLPLSQVQLLTQAERRRIEFEWNGNRREYPRDKCVHQVFEEQAERAPDSIALIFEDKAFTYGELNARANQLAGYLRRMGVGPETLVGICMERSMEMLVGMLGILKAGGAYVPLDPNYPEERLGFMLQDCGMQILLAHEQTVGVMRSASAKVVVLEAEWNVIDRESRDNLQSTTLAENLAYVIYTSGSTGMPKGVCVPHRGIVRLVKNTDYVKLGPDEVFLQFAPISFDAATFEIWGCLLNGARLVVLPPGLPSLADIGRSIRQHSVTVLWLAAGLFREIVDCQVSHLRGVRQLLVGGDVLSAAHVRKALNELSGCTLINGYGPTENTTFSCCYPMHDSRKVGASVWIGLPIANTQAYVLDAHMQPVPIGVPGELFLGGDGLARGYLKRPELTAEKFVPNPFSNVAAARLFRTGDLVRRMPGGELDFL